MGDAIKVAVKTGLIVVFMVAIWALFNVVVIPTITFSNEMIQGIAFAKALLSYWIPHYNELIVLALGIAGFDIGIFLFKLSMTATKWVLKVNE